MASIIKLCILAIFVLFSISELAFASGFNFGLNSNLLGHTENRNHLEKTWAQAFLRKPKPSSVEMLKEIRKLSPLTPAQSQAVDAEVCYTDECLAGAQFLLSGINFTVDPCDDFYEFSCGKWIAENPIPPGAPVARWGQFDALIEQVNKVTQGILTAPIEAGDFKPVKQVKDFYKSCIDTDAMEEIGLIPVLGTLVAYGGWPAITPNWNGNGFNLIKNIGQIRRVFLKHILLTVYVSQDVKNTTQSVIYFDQPPFFLKRSYLLNPEQFQPRINAYKSFFVNVAKEFAILTGAPVTDADLTNQAEEVIAFETRLAEISQDDVNRTNIDLTYNPRKLDAYQEEIDKVGATQPHAQLKWKVLLDEIFASSGVTIQPQENLIVNQLGYLSNLVKVLDSTDIRTVANYILWRFVADIVPQTTQYMRDLKFEFDKVDSGLLHPVPREAVCASASLAGFGMAIGVKYVEEAFNKDAKPNVNLMVENVRVAFKELLNEADWMDEETKSEAQRKADTMKKLMAYPDWLFNQTRLEQEYAGLEIVTNQYLQSVIALSTWQGVENAKLLRKVTDKDMWLSYPGVVDAFYNHASNSITFPAGILAPPFYRSNGIESINYGGIGIVIGHEITHGFDAYGSQFDSDGNVRNWWSDDVREKFFEKAKCIVDQYSNFETEVGFVNGALTAGENIADNGGVHQSFLAYQNWVKNNNNGKAEPRLPGLETCIPEQLFFLGFGNVWCQNIDLAALQNDLIGDAHSPARFRILGPLQNSATFAEHWNCPVGSPMNPKAKCVLW